MKDTVALILAAGKGVRMRSGLAKVMHPICGRPMLSYVLNVVRGLGLLRVLVIVGHQAERIKEVFAATSVEWVVQDKQLGTANAVLCALPRVDGFAGHVLICCGDTPLLTTETIHDFIEAHRATDSDLSVLSMVLKQPGTYGRILRDSKGLVKGIIEARDAAKSELRITEVNTGIYCARADLLRSVIPEIDNTNSQGEYYLTDMVQKAAEKDWKVQAVPASDPQEFMGVNTKEELEAAEAVIAQRLSRASK
jgi:bifunctional UDP-N-acetylglucosamine pyrophosphorylase/glucosamine-1-phosphate N-acetyltransferase